MPIFRIAAVGEPDEKFNEDETVQLFGDGPDGERRLRAR
jgi:hypothetical protein